MPQEFRPESSEPIEEIKIETEKEPTKERGTNVLVRVKFIRHGERTPKGELTDYGRDIIVKKAAESGLKDEKFDTVKAYGSQAGPKVDIALPEHIQAMGRAFETAHIYTQAVNASGKDYVPRPKDILSYEAIKSPMPYDHTKIYNLNLPENYESLSDEEKVQAARKAQSAVVNHLLALNTPEAERYVKEVAGVFAKIINHRIKLSRRLDSGSKVLLVEGTHGPMPELLLREALVRKAQDGQEIRGFEDINEIGGPLYPSESIDVLVERDENGNLKKARVELDPLKPHFEGEMYLDLKKLDELEKFYDAIHGEKE